MAQIRELIEFLHDKNEQVFSTSFQVVWLALQHIAGLSVTEEGKQSLNFPSALQSLIKLTKFSDFKNIQQVH